MGKLLDLLNYPPNHQRFGIAKGLLTIPDSIDTSNEEVARLFMGGSHASWISPVTQQETINPMSTKLIWDEAKRQSNLLKHGLDFCNADCVLESRYCLNIELVRAGELRVQSLSYVFNRLSVLTVVHTARGDATRIISFRYASQAETDAYYEWIGEENDRT